MTQTLRLLLLAAALLTTLGVQAFEDDDEDDEDYAAKPRTTVRSDTPKDRYLAKLDMLNAKVEYRRNVCKYTRSSGAGDYCTKEVDQLEREGRLNIEKEFKAAMEKERAAGK